MTSLERFQAVVQRGAFDRIPYSFDLVPELREKFQPLLDFCAGPKRVEELFQCDRGFTGPKYSGKAVHKFEYGR